MKTDCCCWLRYEKSELEDNPRENLKLEKKLSIVSNANSGASFSVSFWFNWFLWGFQIFVNFSKTN